MTSARSRSREFGITEFTLTGLGNVVITRNPDATRVDVSGERIRTLLEAFLDVNKKGILLAEDETGSLTHRGVRTHNEVSLNRGGFGSKPIVLAVDRMLRNHHFGSRRATVTEGA